MQGHSLDELPYRVRLAFYHRLLSLSRLGRPLEVHTAAGSGVSSLAYHRHMSRAHHIELVVICVAILVGQLYVAISPVQHQPDSAAEAVKIFFSRSLVCSVHFSDADIFCSCSTEAYLAIPINLFIWLVGYLWIGGRPLKAKEIDVDVRSVLFCAIWALCTDKGCLQTGRKARLTVEEVHARRELRRATPRWKRALQAFF